jgi:ABC-type sugar transport system permease subunit
VKQITLGQLRHQWRLYLLILPAVALVLTFSYFPAGSAMYHAFFNWNGDDVSEYVGLDNFGRALTDGVLASSFLLVMVLVVANAVKMVPSIVTAVVIHRLASERSRYLYRVLFVVPMIIPGMVWLLLWKYFYDPTVGVLNGVLNSTGLMDVLRRMDVALPAVAQSVAPVRDALATTPFGGVWGMALTGVLCLSVRDGVRSIPRAWLWWVLLVAAGAIVWNVAAFVEDSSGLRLRVNSGGLLRAVVTFGVCLAAGELLRRRALGRGILHWGGIGLLLTAAGLVLTTMLWPEPTGAFATGNPAWLGHEKLIVPSLIFWGFPWVGVVSVLLYLSGLGNIDQAVYDAAEIDGCNWLRKFTHIELPLIMTQVRLNLILMIIGTLKDWGLIFILLTDTGGPGGAGMVPGLYMFRKAFRDMEAGYACAIGLLLFLLILLLTVVNNRYVRVKK